MNPSSIVRKLWNHCNVLRDDGMPCAIAQEIVEDPASAESDVFRA